MENQFQPSFVPKRAIIPNEAALRPRGRTSFLMLISTIVFLAAIAATAGLFAYKALLTSTNKNKEVKIQEAIRTFEPDLTKQLTVLKARIDAAKQLLQSHAAVSAFLALLEENTAQTIRYSNFAYSSVADKMIVTMKGESASYAAIAFQSDVLSRNENLKSVIFSNLNLAESGLVGFDVKAEIDPKVVSYRAVLEAAAKAEVAPAPTDPIPADSNTLDAGADSTTNTDPINEEVITP